MFLEDDILSLELSSFVEFMEAKKAFPGLYNYEPINTNRQNHLIPTMGNGEQKLHNISKWIKTKNIKNSVILMDELETGLDDQGQLRIMDLLTSFEPSNQYIFFHFLFSGLGFLS